jgi:hypothetical protein
MSCPDAVPVLRDPIAVPDVAPLCGGDVAVTGATPLGPFVASSVWTRVGTEDCFGIMQFTLFTGAAQGPGLLPTGLGLYFSTNYNGGSWLGTFHATAGLSSADRQTSIGIPLTVQVTAADDPYSVDSGAATPPGPPQGQARVTIDGDTGCGHITGSFVAPYCEWIPCIGSP